jgi:hypothetical protein
MPRKLSSRTMVRIMSLTMARVSLSLVVAMISVR